MNSTVIIISDNEALMQVIEGIINQEGYAIIKIENRNALDEVVISPQLILLDLDLIGMDGKQIFKDLKASMLATVPVILFSIKAPKFVLGPHDLLIEKPFGMQQLVTAVNEVVLRSNNLVS